MLISAYRRDAWYMIVRRKARPAGSLRAELVRKTTHVLVGILVVLLFRGGFLDTGIFGLLLLLFSAVVLFNYSYEKELLLKILSLNRSDAVVPGLDLLAYGLGMWLVLALFPREIAFASIMVVAFGDPLAHLVSKGFDGSRAVITRYSNWYGMVAGTLAGTLAAWVFVGSLLSAFLASLAAMFIESCEFRIAEHHIDDNLLIPLVAGTTLWVLTYAF